MQLLAAKGHESGETEGLGWLEAEAVRLEPRNASERIPHIGWNEVRPERPSPLFTGLAEGKDFYFVHSYHLDCRDPSDVLARTPYCGGVVSAVCRGNIYGVQFHPEKSQKAGFALLRNFIAL
jgi:glutamine amidotransferase